MELVPFKINADCTSEALAAACMPVTAWVRTQPGFQSRTLKMPDRNPPTIAASGANRQANQMACLLMGPKPWRINGSIMALHATSQHRSPHPGPTFTTIG